MTTYTWSVNNMFTVNTPDPDYVVNVLWTLTGVDGQTTASALGSTQFTAQQGPTFIPYNQLTEAVVLGWVQDALGTDGIANYEANVQGQINSINTPPVSPENTPLPWAAQATPPAPDMSAPKTK
jgi:hypothetical protein